MPLLNFCCLLAIARSSTMLNKSESGHPCPIPDFRGKILFFEVKCWGSGVSGQKILFFVVYYF